MCTLLRCGAVVQGRIHLTAVPDDLSGGVIGRLSGGKPAGQPFARSPLLDRLAGTGRDGLPLPDHLAQLAGQAQALLLGLLRIKRRAGQALANQRFLFAAERPVQGLVAVQQAIGTPVQPLLR